MPTAHLALGRLDTSPQVWRYLQATPTAVGNTFGSAENDGFSTDPGEMHAQRVCQFKGSNDLYALLGNDIYSYNSGTGNWVSVHTLANPGTTTQARVGPVVMQVNGVPTMVVVYGTPGATTHRIVTSTDGSTWNESADIVNANYPNDSNHWGPLVVGDRLWFWVADADLYYVGVEPSTGTITAVNLTGVLVPATGDEYAFCDHLVWDGIHYLFGVPDSSMPQLFSWDGASATPVLTIPGTLTTGPPTSVPDGKWAMFIDGPDLYLLARVEVSPETAPGWHCWRVQPGLSVTDISSTVLPGSIGVDSNVVDTSGFGVVVDQEANPGGEAEIWLYYRADRLPATPWTVYKWNGNAALIGNTGSPNDIGGSAAHAMAFDGLGSGKLFWTLDELDITIESIVEEFGGELVTFTLYSPSGTETVNVDFFYDDGGENARSGPATIFDASAGTIVGSQIQGLTADNGVTSYTVKWNTTLSGDNVPNGAGANLQARIAI